MNETGQNLTTIQLKTIPILLNSRSITAGVRKAGISRTTLYEWLKNPIFYAAFATQRKELIDLALHELKISTNEAVKVLKELLKSPDESIRLRTSTTILDYVGKFIELEDIEKRVNELERGVKKGQL